MTGLGFSGDELSGLVPEFLLLKIFLSGLMNFKFQIVCFAFVCFNVILIVYSTEVSVEFNGFSLFSFFIFCSYPLSLSPLFRSF